MTRVEATAIAQRFLESKYTVERGSLLIMRAIERPYGWLFSYNSKAFVETRDPMRMLIGKGPLLVRNDGEVR